MDYSPLIVPVAIFVGGIVVTLMCAGLGVSRLVEGQKSADKEIGRTASYAEPFKDSHGRG